MTTQQLTNTAPPRRRDRPLWIAGRHYLEMVVAMVAGMMLLGPVWTTATVVLGGREILGRVDAGALVMATNMAIGMAIWMRYRGHGWVPIAQMSAAMYVPFLAFLVPYWLDAVSGDVVMLGGHVLMLPAMAVAMLARPGEYTRHHHRRVPAAEPSGGLRRGLRRVGAAVAHRWPSLLGLVVAVGAWVDNPMPDFMWVMLVLPVAYIVIGFWRRQFGDRRVLAIQLGGLVLYVVLFLAALGAHERLAAILVGSGWLVHAGWDVAHHRARSVVPRAYAEACAVFDGVIGLTIILALWPR
ncbi:hypothetical protein SAMN05421678_10270 [Actinopolymorpha cephalotaxi]|uniref:Uncharacterized protein n=1 Tax=Actinopolymorpha cephalotaxi TaxID=504797 RepID=A0A1I2LEJ3_9ACTN|nr:hypothetical protein [Actinopolymorpha cephalotaxi]NYH84959.1 hypothetical protein [Actinopolymorpha cephalotaxi]SFF76900.1 hypothetical protein SAMN05421678_10270 [Actinopolymorpha cephalotaxi]